MVFSIAMLVHQRVFQESHELQQINSEMVKSLFEGVKFQTLMVNIRMTQAGQNIQAHRP